MTIETETETTVEYEEIPVDLDPDIICNFIETYVTKELSKPSASYVLKSLHAKDKSDQSLDKVFEAFGRSMFNEILIDIVIKYVDKTLNENENENGVDE